MPSVPLQTDAPEQIVDTETLPETQAEPVPGANATPSQIEALSILEHLEENADAIRAGLEDADATQRGDVAGKAYVSAKVAVDLLDLTADTFARWKPDSGDDIDRAMIQVHNTLKPDAGPAVRDLKRAALWLAIMATDKDTAAIARIGGGTEDKPQYNFVRVRSFPGKNEADERVKGVLKQEEAKPRLVKLAKEASNEVEAGIYRTAIAAIDNVDRLRECANELSAISMARSRWRKWLYVPLIVEYIDKFVAENKGNKDVGDVWVSALTKAQDAHASVIGPARKADGNDANPDDLRAAIKQKVWDEYLQPMTQLGRVIVAAPKVDLDKLTDRFFKLAEELSHALDTDIANIAIIPEFAKVSYNHRPELQKYLGQSPKARKAADVAAERRSKEEAVAATQQVTQQAANDAAATAREQRQAERTSRSTGQTAPATTTPTRRKAVVTPPAAGGSKSERDQMLASLKK